MIIGAHIDTSYGKSIDKYLQWLPASYSVSIDICWMDIETKPGVYTWPDEVTHNLTVLKERGNSVICVVKTCPAFYRKNKAQDMSAPKPANYPDARRFVRELVDRFAPDGIQIWNEPEMGAYKRYYGGFGRYGGKEYGLMLREICRMKEHGRDVKIYGGALAMMSFSWSFLRDMLSVGNIGFDSLSFHTYVSKISDYDLPFVRAAKLRQICKKPLAMTETGYTGDGSEKQELEKAGYWEYLLGNTIPKGIELMHNYCLAYNGWKNTDLVTKTGPTPAYYVWRGDR